MSCGSGCSGVSASSLYEPFETFEKDYVVLDDQPAVCGAYRELPEREVVRACVATDAHGAGRLPGYIDMGKFFAREGTYRAMLATTPASRVPASAFLTINEPNPEFVERFENTERELAADYRHHRVEVLERALRGMQNWRGPAVDRMLTRGTFDPFFRGLGLLRDPEWQTVEDARDAVSSALDEARRALETDEPAQPPVG